jgi:ribosomal-protein-alanine N-acetyltransferase
MDVHPDNSGWVVRPGNEADLAEIVLLERETLTAPHWSAAEYSAVLKWHGDGGLRRCVYVAAQGRFLAGYAVGSVVGVGHEAESELESVVVRDELRRQGLGSALCRAVMEWSRREGAPSIALEVRAASAGAVKLYGGLGFVATGRRPRYYHDPADDAVVMHCALSGKRPASVGADLYGDAALF